MLTGEKHGPGIGRGHSVENRCDDCVDLLFARRGAYSVERWQCADARAGQTSRKAIGSVLSVLTRLRANVLGLVLNEVNKEMSDSYYYYGYYRSYYRPKEEARTGA